jgi:hypothetical protein
MNNYRSNVGVSMTTDTFSETAPKSQTRRRTMEKAGNNPEKEKLKPEQKDQGMKMQTLHRPRSKESCQKQ